MTRSPAGTVWVVLALLLGACVPAQPPGASSARDVSDADKAAVYARYGIPWVPYAHEVDHLISLELGGSNAIRNLWPEPYAGRWGARTKDVLENRLHDMVCAGELALRAAQRQEATDWVRAYLRYVGRPPGRGDNGGSASAGGYYSSSYPSASTIYCADDPERRTLSRTYRVYFATLARALARSPSYHLHEPCWRSSLMHFRGTRYRPEQKRFASLAGRGHMGERPSVAVDPKELARLTESLAKLTQEYEDARESDNGESSTPPDRSR